MTHVQTRTNSASFLKKKRRLLGEGPQYFCLGRNSLSYAHEKLFNERAIKSRNIRSTWLKTEPKSRKFSWKFQVFSTSQSWKGTLRRNQKKIHCACTQRTQNMLVNPRAFHQIHNLANPKAIISLENEGKSELQIYRIANTSRDICSNSIAEVHEILIVSDKPKSQRVAKNKRIQARKRNILLYTNW